MVLEAIMSVKDVVKNPWHMLIFGAVISVISIGVSYLVFPETAGLFTVFLVTIICAPFMLRLLSYEEDREEKEVDHIGILERINPIGAFFRQFEIFIIYAAFFAGVTIALSLAFVFLPESFVERVFNEQITQVNKISLVLGNITMPGVFNQIFMNNLIVMSMSFLFALLFGIGAIFILTWNASVLAAAAGMLTKNLGLSLPEALARFLPHGVFEISGYFVAGIAGGILSMLIAKRKSKDFGRVIEDMVILMIFSIILIFIGAYIESQAIIA
jgi:uncharacterized membrane protein SpoIIM required for sporulation